MAKFTHATYDRADARSLMLDFVKVALWAKRNLRNRVPKPEHFADRMTTVEYWTYTRKAAIQSALRYRNLSKAY